MPKDIKTLRQAAMDLKAEGRKIVDTARAEDRDFTEDETRRMDEIEKEIGALNIDMARAERLMDLERTFAPFERQAEDLVGDAPPISTDPRLTGGFANMAEFGRAVMEACLPGGGGPASDQRLANLYKAQPTQVHQETGTNEGYLVPPAFRDQIWELVFMDGADSLLTDIDSEPTASNQVNLLADETTPWAATGIIAKWRSEVAKMDPTKLDHDPRTVRMHDLFVFVNASDDLLEDAPRLANRLSVRSAAAIRWKGNYSIIWGTGAGQPLGYMNSGALVSVAKEGGQTADTVVTKNISKMFSRLIMVPGGMPRWNINPDVIPEIMELQVGNQPIWTPPNAGFAMAPGGFLMGLPIRLTDNAKTLGDKGDVQLVDPKGYYGINKRNNITFASSIHLFFDYGVQSFRWTFRMGGQPHLSAPVTPQFGTATRSHFVTLDERA